MLIFYSPAYFWKSTIFILSIKIQKFDSSIVYCGGLQSAERLMHSCIVFVYKKIHSCTLKILVFSLMVLIAKYHYNWQSGIFKRIKQSKIDFRARVHVNEGLVAELKWSHFALWYLLYFIKPSIKIESKIMMKLKRSRMKETGSREAENGCLRKPKPNKKQRKNCRTVLAFICSH